MDFNVSKQVGNYFYVDEVNKKWSIPQGLFKSMINPKIYNYTDIVDFELIEDGNSVSKGGVGRALVGGILFGGVGAIVGGMTNHKHKQTCTKLQIKITLRNIKNPTEYITLINTETKKNSFIYKSAYNKAQQIMSLLQIICDNVSKNQTKANQINNSNSKFDEIKKYKELLDIGAISQEEFEQKKKELLNINNSLPNSTKFCQFCGKNIPSDSKICVYCGKQL